MMRKIRVLVTTSGVGSLHELKTTWLKQTTEEFDVTYNRYDNNNYPSRENSMSARLKGKIHRMLEWEEYPDYDYYIWMDSTFHILKPDAIKYAVASIGSADICLFPHPDRHSIREELDLVNELVKQGNPYIISRYGGERINQQVRHYYLDEDFVDDTLFATGCFIYSRNLVENREHNLMKEWFYHNCIWSVQDQLSLPYLIKKMQVNYNLFDTDIYHNPYFVFDKRLVIFK